MVPNSTDDVDDRRPADLAAVASPGFVAAVPAVAAAPPRAIASSTATPAGAMQGQLSGAILVLVVLAVVGVAAWGVRPDLLDRVVGSTGVRGWTLGHADAGPADVAAEELLSDEERIIGLLEENDGRLKQQHVVETTDWSKAKVSRLLSSMEDDEAIVRIQLGREKLIFLSGHEPSGARSTLDGDR